jgi:hypothetical protein
LSAISLSKEGHSGVVFVHLLVRVLSQYQSLIGASTQKSMKTFPSTRLPLDRSRNRIASPHPS